MFCFLKTMCVLDHQESDNQSSFFDVEYQKDVRANGLRISQTTAKNKLSEPIVWPFLHSQKGQFSLTGRGGWYRQDLNTIQSCENRDFSI